MLLGITLGDVSGVGPEIVLRAYVQKAINHTFVVIGDLSVLCACRDTLGLAVDFLRINQPEDARPGAFNLIDMKLIEPGQIEVGTLSKHSGLAAYQYLQHAVDLALAKRIDAVVTLPMNKEATRLSIPDFAGHTDVIAQKCQTRDYSLTLISDKLIVPHVSAHVSLREAIERTRTPRILKVIQLADMVAERLGRIRRIAVLGLNPHSGEGGAFGREDIEHIVPAIQAARELGIEAVGPVPPDTAFMRALRGEFSAVVCMYHDQGHIAMKTLGFDNAVNVTVGLPIIRTSVDHGTAFDIAWKGTASLGSFIKACDLAAQLA
jgi:4-hydroxythreonine-4-phosphate dehydrogenase